jgi:hypothetical protein
VREPSVRGHIYMERVVQTLPQAKVTVQKHYEDVRSFTAASCSQQDPLWDFPHAYMRGVAPLVRSSAYHMMKIA